MSKANATTTSLLAAAVSVAVLTFEVNAAEDFRLFPAGEFRARDGRPKNVAAWRMDATIAARLVEQVAATGVDFVIDYEHQTLLAEQNGQPAPAAGWFGKLEWREDDGLYVVGTKWTDRAAGYIEADEYRYISPVFEYDKTGAPTRLLHVALTNNPALDFQPGVAEAVAAKFQASLSLNHQETVMDKLLEQLLERLRWFLNLPEGATIEDYSAQLQKIQDQLKAAGGATAATSFDLSAYLATQETQIATLKSAPPDPAKFVSVETMQQLQGQVAALTAKLQGNELGEIVTAALTAGKLLPAQEAWALDLGKKDLAALKSFVESAPVVAPVATQTGGSSPDGATPNATDTDLAVMKALGLSADQFAAGKIKEV